MARDASATGATDATSTAQARFTVQLSADMREPLESLGRRMAESVAADIGIMPEFSLAQVVTGLIKARVAELAGRDAQTAANGSGEPGTVRVPDGEPANAGTAS